MNTAAGRRLASGGRTPPWWQADPNRWQAERAALIAAGVRWLDEPATSNAAARKSGWVVIQAGSELTAGSRAAGLAVRLLVSFPAAYPWFPPTVWDSLGQLPWLARHVGPSRLLCLLHDRHWRIETTLAELLRTQLPPLLATGDPNAEQRAGRPALAAMESTLPEPAGLSVTAQPGWTVLVDSTWKLPPKATAGLLDVQFENDPVGGSEHRLGQVRRVGGPRGVLAEAGPGLVSAFGWPVPACWVRLDAAPTIDAAEFYDQIAGRLQAPVLRELPTLPRTTKRAAKTAQAAAPTDDSLEESTYRLLCQLANVYAHRRKSVLGRIEVIGLYHPAETGWRTTGWRWLFLVRMRTDRRSRWQVFYVRAAYAGRADLLLRAPDAKRLQGASVLQVGLGSIGSRVADGLARAGVGAFTLVDNDVLEPGNIVRHAAPSSSIGQSKVTAMLTLLRAIAPLAEIHGATMGIGSIDLSNTELDEHDWLLRQVAAATLVVDTGANPAVSTYLAALCQATGAPFVHASATAGAWGGLVVQLRPDRGGGCWGCLLHHRADKTVPVPPADPSGNHLVPVGCAEPTFIGAAADLDTIAIHAVRIITALLIGDPDRNVGGDVDGGGTGLAAALQVATLRTPSGPVAASWQGAAVPIHPHCPHDHHADARG